MIGLFFPILLGGIFMFILTLLHIPDIPISFEYIFDNIAKFIVLFLFPVSFFAIFFVGYVYFRSMASNLIVIFLGFLAVLGYLLFLLAYLYGVDFDKLRKENKNKRKTESTKRTKGRLCERT